MAKVKQSFLSNLLGEHNYEEYSSIAMKIVVIGGLVLITLFALSYFFHSGIINYLLKLATGTSLLFIAYIAACILLLDIRVEVEKPEQEWWDEKKESRKPLKYKLTIVWGVVLLLLGIAAIYFSNKYRNRYDFECTTFLVDHKAHVYHLDWNDDCEDAANAEELEKMYGYEIDNSYTFCEGCKEYEEDVESEAATVRIRR
jgi:amino acid transporter